MPVIPVIETPPVGKMEPSALPMGPVALPGNPGQNIQQAAVAIAGGIEQASQRAEEEKRKADAITVADAENRYAREVDDALRNEKGYFATQGEDSLDTSKAHQTVETIRQKYADEFAGNQEALNLFNIRSGVFANSVHKDVEEHATRQRNVFAARVADDTAERALATARKNYANVGRLENTWLDAASFLGPMWNQMGYSDQEVEHRLDVLRAAILNTAAQEFLTHPDQASMGAAFLQVKLQDGKTVAEAMGDSDGTQQTRRALQAFAAQESGHRLALNLATDPKYRSLGQVNYDAIRKDLDKSYLAESQGKKGPIELGSFEVYDAAKKMIDAKEQDDQKGLAIHDGALLRVTRSWFERNGLPSFSQFETSKDPVVQRLRAALVQGGLLLEVKKWRADWDIAKNAGPPDPVQSLNMTRFLWNVGNNENAYTGMTADEFEGKVLRNLHPSDINHARGIMFGIMSQKGPMKARYLEGKKAVEGLLRANNDIPSQNNGDVKANDPSTWSLEQQEAYQTAMLMYDDEFQNSSKAGEAPSYEDTMKIAQNAGRKVKVPGRLYGTNEMSIAKAIAEGRGDYAFVPPEAGSREWNYYAGIARAAREKEATRLEGEGKKAEADALRARPVDAPTIHRLFFQDVEERAKRFQGAHPGYAPPTLDVDQGPAPMKGRF